MGFGFWLFGYMFTIGLVYGDVDPSFWNSIRLVFMWPFELGNHLKEKLDGSSDPEG